MLLLYAINLSVTRLFVDSFFIFLKKKNSTK